MQEISRQENKKLGVCTLDIACSFNIQGKEWVRTNIDQSNGTKKQCSGQLGKIGYESFKAALLLFNIDVVIDVDYQNYKQKSICSIILIVF